jgi:hypothetical protein
MATGTDFLATYIGPIAEDLTPRQAEKILAATPSPELIARVQELADKASTGTLTTQERVEYEYYIDVDDVIGLLKSRARRVISGTSN